MTVQEYLTTYNILFVVIQTQTESIGHHYSKFYKFPYEWLNSKSFKATIYGAGKVIITITK